MGVQVGRRVAVDVLVAVEVEVAVGVCVGLEVGVGVRVTVAVAVEVDVGVEEAVEVDVAVSVAVGVGEANIENTGELHPVPTNTNITAIALTNPSLTFFLSISGKPFYHKISANSVLVTHLTQSSVFERLSP